jgi:hypothetical protein
VKRISAHPIDSEGLIIWYSEAMRSEFLKRLLKSVEAIRSGIEGIDKKREVADIPTKIRAEIHFDDSTVEATRTEQDRVFKNQVSIRKATWLTFAATALAFLAAAVYAGIALYQAGLMREATGAAQRSADAAGKQLEVAQRPWVRLHLALAGPLVFDKDGFRTELKVVMKNSGASPALSVLMQPELRVNTAWPESDLINERDKLCDRLKQQATVNNESLGVVFPGTDGNTTVWHIGISKSDVDNVLRDQNSQVLPMIFSCVVYRFTFNEAYHQTAYTSAVLTFDPKSAHAFGTGVTLKPGLVINPDHLYMANEVHAD